MPITDFLDNVPPPPEGYRPYTPPGFAPGYRPPPIVTPEPRPSPIVSPGRQYPVNADIPSGFWGFVMLMMGLK